MGCCEAKKFENYEFRPTPRTSYLPEKKSDAFYDISLDSRQSPIQIKNDP